MTPENFKSKIIEACRKHCQKWSDCKNCTPNECEFFQELKNEIYLIFKNTGCICLNEN
jgi:hypothetical protein